MTWLHYSEREIALASLESRSQKSTDSAYAKPAGFWITDDSEHCWKSWCEAESFRLEALQCVHEIELDEARILLARDALDLDVFTERYGARSRFGSVIDWERVASEYAGMIVTPYVWERRLHPGYSWYYGWDCASGCIWDVGAVLNVRALAATIRATKEKA